MTMESLLSTFKNEVIESLSRNDKVTSRIPGIEYIEPGANPKQKKICVATYSKEVDAMLPKSIELAGGVCYRISTLSSDLPDMKVQIVPMSTFDEKD